jgi:hypothetical protein
MWGHHHFPKNKNNVDYAFAEFVLRPCLDIAGQLEKYVSLGGAAVLFVQHYVFTALPNFPQRPRDAFYVWLADCFTNQPKPWCLKSLYTVDPQNSWNAGKRQSETPACDPFLRRTP